MAVEILEIRANIDDIDAKLKQVNALLVETNRKAVINIDGKKGFDEVQKAAKETEKAIDKASDSANKMGRDFDRAGVALDKTTDKAKQTEKAIDGAGRAVVDTGKAVVDTGKAFDDTTDKAKETGRAIVDTGTQGKKAGEDIGKAYETAGQKLITAEAKLTQISNTLREQEQITNEFKKELLTLQQRYEQLGNKGSGAGFRIKAQMDQLNAAIKDQTQSVKALKSEQTQQKAVVANLKNQIKETKNQTKETEKLGGAMGRLIPLVAAAFSVQRIIAFGKEAIIAADAAAGITIAFNRTGKSILELRSATRGAISDVELMKAAVNAKNLGVPISELSGLLAFAAQRAGETGQTVDALVNSIVVGLGRKSTKILDDLGISALELKEALGDVSLEQASVAQLTTALNKVIDQQSDSTDYQASSIQQLSSAYDNLTVTIGKMLNTSSGISLFAKDVQNLSTVLDTSTLTSFEKITLLLGNITVQGQLAFKAAAFEADAFARSVQAGNADLSTMLSELKLLNDELKQTLLGENQSAILFELKEQIKALDEQILNATSMGEIYTLNAQRIGVINQIKTIEKGLSEQELRIQTEINAQLRIRNGLEETGVDPTLEGDFNFANDPFDTIISDAEKVTQGALEVWEKFYDEELLLQADSILAKQEADQRYADYKLQLEMQTQQAIGDLLMAATAFAVAIGSENAENAKALAAFQALLSAFVAINNVMANPQLLFPANLIASAAIGVQAFANVAAIQSQSVPSFYKGTDFLGLNGNPKGKDTIPIYAHEGEAIIPAFENAKYPGATTALVNGDFDRYLSVEHVIPALKAQKKLQEREQNEVMATAIRGVVKAELKDDRIVNRLQHLIYANEEIAEAMKRKRRNPYRANY